MRVGRARLTSSSISSDGVRARFIGVCVLSVEPCGGEALEAGRIRLARGGEQLAAAAFGKVRVDAARTNCTACSSWGRS